MIIKLKSAFVRHEGRYFEDAYWLANEGRMRRIILQSLVVLRLKLRIERLVERVHIELKRIR